MRSNASKVRLAAMPTMPEWEAVADCLRRVAAA